MKTENYPYSILEEKVNDLKVEIVGVQHNNQFFSEYRPFLEDRISESDAVMVEGRRNLWEGRGEGYDFFKSVCRIAGSQKKKIYQADPRTKKTGKIDLCQAVIGGCILLSNDSLYHVPVGLYLMSGSFFGIIARYIPKVVFNCGLRNMSHNYEVLFYGETDYANVMISEGLSKISKKDKDVRKIVCFHGDAHSKPIGLYLRHPVFRKFKEMLYLPTYEPFSDARVREYSLNSQGWGVIKEF